MVAPEDLVVAWQMSETAEEAAAKLAMKVATLIAMVESYREKGVKLKVIPMGEPNQDASLVGIGLNHE